MGDNGAMIFIDMTESGGRTIVTSAIQFATTADRDAAKSRAASSGEATASQGPGARDAAEDPREGQYESEPSATGAVVTIDLTGGEGPPLPPRQGCPGQWRA